MIRGARRLPPCLRHPVRAEGGRTMPAAPRPLPSPPSAPPRSRGRGAHEGIPLPSPPALLSPVRAAPWGVHAERGRTRVRRPRSPPFPWKGCTQGHATPPLRVAPAPSSLRPGHATPPLFTRRARARLVTQKGRRAPRPVPSARATPAQPHAPRLALPLHAGGLQEGLRAHPQPPGLRGGQRAHPGHRRAMPSPGFARIAPPVHARGRKRDGTRTSPGLRVPPPRGARKREGRTHAREG
ncbi:hypothetical protein EDB84DRAFT_1576118 [Lactarius hengduanensis]|nr:hypothetical protein EDB84DRAFT_1576118 [Lactarius hengduanensis]